MIVSI